MDDILIDWVINCTSYFNNNKPGFEKINFEPINMTNGFIGYSAAVKMSRKFLMLYLLEMVN